MKNMAMIGLVAAGLMFGSAMTSLQAQNGPGNGRGYGGPPKSEEERAARQAACLEMNGGICPNGGPRAAGGPKGMGKGNGQGWRHGLRDGTGPRNASGTCPLNASVQPKN
jgi:hypothetical protein